MAVAQAELAVANAFDGAGTGVLDYRYLPHVTFTSPAAAGVGLTEEQARESGRPYEVRVLPVAHIGRTMVSRRPHGMVKLVSDGETDRLLGVRIVGDEAGEIIVAATYALEAGFAARHRTGPTRLWRDRRRPIEIRCTVASFTHLSRLGDGDRVEAVGLLV
ncbi:hypothetical protein ACSLFT_16980 [Streptomyces sp. G6]|uniref:hypothetical protein n=1 Tax=Streptomyces sp. G6 TaxID=1178736 RepID=UPI003ED8F7D4